MESGKRTVEIDDRYARLRLIAWWNQRVLTQARVMVVGAGALGNEVLKNLALLGVGLIYIVDKDTIETSNLSRSVLFRAEDVSQPKALVAAQRVREINPDVQAIGFQGDIGLHVGLGTTRSMQIIIGCLDNLESRRILNLNCWRVGRPWVDAAIDALSGYVRVISPAEVNSGCYECTLTEADYRILNQRAYCPPFRALPDGRYPTTPTSAAILGAMQSQEAMKLLHALPVRAGYSTYYSGTTLQTRTVQITRRPDCPAHYTFSNITQLSTSVMAETTTSLLGKLTALWGESVTLLLPREVVTSFKCSVCQDVESVFAPYDEVVPTRVACPHCQSQRGFDVTVMISGKGPSAEIPLQQLGIPLWPILTLRTESGERFVELTGDAHLVIPPTSKSEGAE